MIGYDSSVWTPDGVATRMVSVPVVAKASLLIVNGYEPGSVEQGTVKLFG